jgi:ankyrin repeat protein
MKVIKPLVLFLIIFVAFPCSVAGTHRNECFFLQNNQDKPLFDAVMKCDLNKVKALVAAGADVNAKDGEVTALALAIDKDKCSIEIVDALLAAGANPNMRITLGWTPLMWASSMYRPDIVKSLVAAGADVNAIQRTGKTALMLVVQQSDVTDIVKLLLASGANVSIKDAEGRTARDYARNGKIRKLLKEAGAK